MDKEIIVAIIAGGCSLVAALITGNLTAKKSENAIRTSQAVTETKLDELTREVREHNNFAKRMPVVEEQIKSINHRVKDLEGFHKHP